MLHPRDAGHRRHELAPALALGGQDVATGGGYAIEAAAPLARLLHPPPRDPAALLHAVEEGIERCDVEGEDAARAGRDELAEIVAVPRLMLQQRQDEELR